MTKFWGISDTHGMHRQAIIPDNVDCILYGGDSTNSMNLNQNLIEFEDFFNWFSELSIPNKVLIAGNHDIHLTKQYIKDKVKEAGIIYLEDDYFTLNSIKIFGSPWTPRYGDWSFMKDRSKMDPIWRHVEPDTDIWLIHGPPEGILDLTEDREYRLVQAGDISLYKRVMEKRPKYVVYGHIHDFKTCKNFGTLKRDFGTTFMNVSSVEDGRFDKGLIHNGITFE